MFLLKTNFGMELIAHPLCFFNRQSEAEVEGQITNKATEAPHREKRLFCAQCRHPITHDDERIAMQGDHEHSFTNPHGFTFRIGCFRQAPGCVAIGTAATEYSWFNGYQWRIALCANCEAHLGWLFTSPDDRFHGLILNRLKWAGQGP
jgi:hypothetical protein